MSEKKKLWLSIGALLISTFLLVLALRTPKPGTEPALPGIIASVDPAGEIIAKDTVDGMVVRFFSDLSSDMAYVQVEIADAPAPLYLYVDDRQIVMPFITRLNPTGYFDNPGRYTFPLPPESEDWDSVYFYITDLFGRHLEFASSVALK